MRVEKKSEKMNRNKNNACKVSYNEIIENNGVAASRHHFIAFTHSFCFYSLCSPHHACSPPAPAYLPLSENALQTQRPVLVRTQVFDRFMTSKWLFLSRFVIESRLLNHSPISGCCQKNSANFMINAFKVLVGSEKKVLHLTSMAKCVPLKISNGWRTGWWGTGWWWQNDRNFGFKAPKMWSLSRLFRIKM